MTHPLPCRLPLAACRLPLAACRLPLAACRLPLAFLMFALLGGCGEKETTQSNGFPSSSVVAPSNPDNLVFEVGKVIAGQVVSHDFLVHNDSDEPIEIKSDPDIHVNCGCSSLVPATRHIEPGSQTVITATVHTKDRKGPFAYGGWVQWTSPSGATRTVSVNVKGDALPPLAAKPDILRFDPREVRDGVVKDLLLAGNLPLDVASFCLALPSKSFRLVGSESNGDQTHCQIQCVVSPEGMEILSGTLFVSARVADSSRTLPGVSVSAEVHLEAVQELDLVITPKIVPITFRGSETQGTARLLIRGNLLNKGKAAIRSITHDAFQVDWNLSEPTASNTAILDLNFTPKDDRTSEGGPLQFLFEGKELVRLPVSILRTKQSKN